MGSEATLPKWASDPCLMGIDEAGRGPDPWCTHVCTVLAHIGGLLLLWSLQGYISTLVDSKTLKEERREELFETLKNNESIGWAVDILDPTELSPKMLQKNKINLNEMSHNSAIGLVDRVLKMGVLLTEVYIDTVGDAEKYQLKLSTIFPAVKFVVAKKAVVYIQL